MNDRAFRRHWVNRSYSEARRDYWTECWFPPTIEEMKSDGRSERLSKDVQAEYLERERYRRENQDKIAKLRAVWKQAEKPGPTTKTEEEIKQKE